MEIDIPKFLGATTRKITTRDHNGQWARAMTISRTYATTREDLWNALTSPERIPRWFLPISGNLELGGHYQLEGNAGGDILTCAPPDHFHITWVCGTDTSWVTVRLTEEFGRTRLTLEHLAVVPDEFWEQYGPGATGVGWELGLIGLELHLQMGGTVDPAEVMAWTSSEDGKMLIRGSSEAWGDTSIAAGTPEEDARAAAERTTAFYTGSPPAEGE